MTKGRTWYFEPRYIRIAFKTILHEIFLNLPTFSWVFHRHPRYYGIECTQGLSGPCYEEAIRIFFGEKIYQIGWARIERWSHFKWLVKVSDPKRSKRVEKSLTNRFQS